MATLTTLFDNPKVSKRVKTEIKEMRKNTVKIHHQRFEQLLTDANVSFQKSDNRITIPIVNSKTANKIKLIVKQVKEEYPNLDFSTMIVATEKYITIKDRRK